MNKASLICYGTVASNEDIIGNHLPEDFDLQYVCDDLLCLAINVWVNEGDIVITRDYVSQC
jgi:hypothetical protein